MCKNETQVSDDLESLSDIDLDRLAAVEVMEWTISEQGHGCRKRPVYVIRPGATALHWKPSVDLNDAWKLVEKVDGEFQIRRWELMQWIVNFHLRSGVSIHGVAKHPARTITIAAIKAKRSLKDTESDAPNTSRSDANTA